MSSLSEAEFHERADELLGALETHLESLDEAVEDFDLSFSVRDSFLRRSLRLFWDPAATGRARLSDSGRAQQGVLTLRLGRLGTYVLNKQTPNRQIWWSSPTSGPKRFAWDAETQQWRSTRNHEALLERLETELTALTRTPLGLVAKLGPVRRG